MSKRPIRCAVRALIVHEDRLLLVNAWKDARYDLMCAPGGGAEPGSSLPQNLAREVYEETGLRVQVGAPALVNEFHDPRSGYHQMEVFFHCTLMGSTKVPEGWVDPEAIVSRHHWVTQDELASVNHKPDSLGAVAFADHNTDPIITYDPLEAIVS